MTTQATDRMDELIVEKLDCLTRLRQLGVRQLELVRGGGISELLDVLTAKQRVIVQLQRIETDIDPFRDEEPSARVWRSEDARRDCADRIAQCESLLAEIVTSEKQAERELSERRDRTATQLHNATRANQANTAYIDPRPPGGQQLDLTSER